MTAETPTAPVAAEGRELKLYELTGEYLELEALLKQQVSVEIDDGYLDSGDGDDAEVLQDSLNAALDRLGGAIEQKAESIAKVIRQGEANAAWMDEQAAKFQEEAERIRRRAEVRRNAGDRLKDYLQHNLAALGEDTQRVAGKMLSVTLSARPKKDAVVVTDEDALSPDFKRATLTMPLSQVPAELRDAIKAVGVAKSDLNKYVDEHDVLPAGVTTEPGKRRLSIQ